MQVQSDEDKVKSAEASAADPAKTKFRELVRQECLLYGLEAGSSGTQLDWFARGRAEFPLGASSDDIRLGLDQCFRTTMKKALHEQPLLSLFKQRHVFLLHDDFHKDKQGREVLWVLIALALG